MGGVFEKSRKFSQPYPFAFSIKYRSPMQRDMSILPLSGSMKLRAPLHGNFIGDSSPSSDPPTEIHAPKRQPYALRISRPVEFLRKQQARRFLLQKILPIVSDILGAPCVARAEVFDFLKFFIGVYFHPDGLPTSADKNMAGILAAAASGRIFFIPIFPQVTFISIMRLR